MGGGPAHFADLLAEEYVLSEFDTSFAKLDQEQRNQRGAEMTILLAMIAAPLIDTAVYGRAHPPMIGITPIAVWTILSRKDGVSKAPNLI